MSNKEVKDKFTLAKEQLDRANGSWGGTNDEPENVIMWCFYALENAVVAAAEATGWKWKRTHHDKVELAKKLHSKGIVNLDVSGLLTTLNEARKDVAYGEPGSMLREIDLEDMLSQVEEFMEQVKGIL